MNRATRCDPHWEEHMKDSLACLSCIVTLTGCITALCLYLKQVRGTFNFGEERNSLMRVILEMQMIA